MPDERPIVERPEWAPSTDEELHGADLVSYWGDQALVWRNYSALLEDEVHQAKAINEGLTAERDRAEARLLAFEERLGHGH